MLRAIGIDLGTTQTVMASLRRGEPEVIVNRTGSPLTPSVVGLSSTGELLVGEQAREREAEDPTQVALSFKPRIGLPGSVRWNGLNYTPGELAILLLSRLKEEAEAALGEPVGRAVLAVPACFGQAQAAALRDAARAAGFFVLRLIHDPTASALAYVSAHPASEGQTLVVYDLGGGCFDVAVVRLLHGALTVLGVAGNPQLGGDTLTERIATYLLHRLQTAGSDRPPRLHLRRAAEQAKVALSTVEYSQLSLGPAETGTEGILARAQLEEWVRPDLECTLALLEEALAMGGLAREDVDGLLLAGGSAQMPLLQTLLAERLPRARFLRDFNPLLGVAMGAAVLTGMLSQVTCPTCLLPNPRESFVCRRCRSALVGEPRLTCPRCFLPNDRRRRACWKCGASLRVARRQRPRLPATRTCPWERPVGGAPHTPLAAPLPEGLRCSRCGLVQKAGAEACPNCGELVAPFVGDITACSLGIEASDGRMDIILPRGQGLPTSRPACREFRLREAGQRELTVVLYEGEEPLACQNRPCGSLILSLPEGLTPGTAVQVAFSLDADGLLAVEARPADGSDREVDARVAWLGSEQASPTRTTEVSI